MMITILVVDDDAATAAMLREALEMDGYRVVQAVAGASLGVALTEQPRLILLDINMPGMDGPEVARRLRADPATAHIPIVVLSNTLARGGVPPEMPNDDRLPKPCALDALSATVARWTA